MFDVICVGDVAVDHIYRVDYLPKPDQKVYADYLGKFIGGTTFNTVYALKTLGSRVMFLTIIGKDDEAKFIKQQFEENVLDFRTIQTETLRTPVTLIMIAESGEKVIYLLMKDERRDEITNELRTIPFEDGKVVFSTLSIPIHEYLSRTDQTLIISLEEPTLERYPNAFDWASKKAHTLVLDRHAFKKLFQKDATTANLEKIFLNGKYTLENLIVTLGEKGSMAFSNNQKKAFLSHPFTINPVDTTGAGDIFNAAFIHTYYIKNLVLEEALRYANALAAASCEEQGTKLSNKSIQRATNMLQERR
jgi:sugar/nucleoside kinase (ribokinase family)